MSPVQEASPPKPPERSGSSEESGNGESGQPGHARQVASASVWTISSMGAMSLMRLGSQMLLTYLLAREYFGTIALMRVALVFLEMLSDVGIRGSVVYHKDAEKPAFLNTAWTLQILRGFLMWFTACACAVPIARFYDQPVLMWLLPVVGLEAVNNGFLSVHIFTAERHLRLKVPVLLDWIGLSISIATTVVWALIDPSVWALAAGPLAGGVVKTVMSHRLFPVEPLRLAWAKEHVRALFGFGKWVIGGTLVSFVAQQFHILYLGKFLPMALLGVYTVAWNFTVQASKPLTMLSNRVIIPHFAGFARQGRQEHGGAVDTALGRFLPASLLVCVVAGLGAPVLFGFFYEKSFVAGGAMGRLLAVVVWFMVLQHVPRSALLSMGVSRHVAGMALVNAIFTVAGIVTGYALQGSVPGAIIGNAVGNLAGCVYGAHAAHRLGLRIGPAMARYSVVFLAISAAGYGLTEALHGWFNDPTSAFVATAVFALPLSLLVWVRTGRPLLRGGARA